MVSTERMMRTNPCKACGSTMIEFKSDIMQMYDSGNDLISVYCCCANCGYRSPEFTSRFNNMSEAEEMAYSLWNRYTATI